MNTRTLTLLGLALAVALAPLAADAQERSRKLYRWVDADGKVHYSDSLPPEAVDQARRELSANTGLTVGEVQRSLTDEERAELAAAEAQARSEEEARQRDQVLLASYPSEADLERAYQDRVKLMEETVRATQVGIEGQTQSLASILENAADRELTGQPVDARMVERIREVYRAAATQQALLQRREAERAALDQEYTETMERYRRLSEEREARFRQRGG